MSLAARKFSCGFGARHLQGTIGLKAKVTNWLTNTVLLNSFRMTPSDMERYINVINRYKPD